jgi:hypothetical protein
MEKKRPSSAFGTVHKKAIEIRKSLFRKAEAEGNDDADCGAAVASPEKGATAGARKASLYISPRKPN